MSFGNRLGVIWGSLGGQWGTIRRSFGINLAPFGNSWGIIFEFIWASAGGHVLVFFWYALGILWEALGIILVIRLHWFTKTDSLVRWFAVTPFSLD